jgi:hypothetical protein
VKGNDMSIKWDNATIPWRNIDSTVEDIHLAEDNQSYHPVEQEMNRMNEILDAKYSKADLNEIAESADHLTTSEQQKLLALLKKYEDLFDGTLGTFTGAPYDIKLKDNVEPHHARPFPVPKIHELTLKSELDRSCELNVLKRVNRSQWGAPTFVPGHSACLHRRHSPRRKRIVGRSFRRTRRSLLPPSTGRTKSLTSAHTKWNTQGTTLPAPVSNLSQRRSKQFKQSKCPKPVSNYEALLA